MLKSVTMLPPILAGKIVSSFAAPLASWGGETGGAFETTVESDAMCAAKAVQMHVHNARSAADASEVAPKWVAW